MPGHFTLEMLYKAAPTELMTPVTKLRRLQMLNAGMGTWNWNSPVPPTGFPSESDFRNVRYPDRLKEARTP